MPAGPAKSFDEALRTALDFLSNPWNLWASGQLEHRRTVLKLVFVERLNYVRDNGFRTANLSLPAASSGRTARPAACRSR